MGMLWMVACLCTCLDGVPAGRCEHHWESVRMCAAACGQEVDGGPVTKLRKGKADGRGKAKGAGGRGHQAVGR